jgi:diaminopropionate ammonia-lyase
MKSDRSLEVPASTRVVGIVIDSTPAHDPVPSRPRLFSDMPGIRFASNPYRETGVFPQPDRGAVRAFHRSLPGYQPTPLIRRPALARELGVGDLYVKFEGPRFGLGAFKGLGASWALERLVRSRGAIPTVATATDGNHGRGVAWAARRLGIPAVIYLPDHSAAQRVENIRNEGATVVLVDGDYDDAVSQCADDAARNGWQVVADIGYEGYLEIPGWIAEGYSTIFAEIDERLAETRWPEPDVVIVPAGVGAIFQAAVDHYRQRPNPPRLVAAEPDEADCLTASIESPGGVPTPSRGTIHSVMACLNAGNVSLTAWPTIRRGADMFIALDDHYAMDAMRRMYHATGDDQSIAGGESGAASVGALIALAEEPRLKRAWEALGLNRKSVVLAIATEGAVDPVAFEEIVGAKP